MHDALRALGVAPASEPQRLEGGTVNANFIVDGRWVLRRHDRNPDIERARLQARFQVHLDEQRFPVPRIVGDPVRVDGAVWSLSEFVEGPLFDFGRPMQIAEAGRRLAQLHDVARSFRAVHVPAGGRVWPLEWCAAPELHLQDVRETFGPRHIDEFARAVRHVLEITPVARTAELETQWVHGDYHGLNMIFDGDRLAALLDFDAVHVSSRVTDVARGMFSFGRERRGSTTLRPAVVREFLRNYGPLTELERDFVPACLILYWAEDAPHAERYARMGRDPGRELARKLPILVALAKQAGYIASLVETE